MGLNGASPQSDQGRAGLWASAADPPQSSGNLMESLTSISYKTRAVAPSLGVPLKVDWVSETHWGTVSTGAKCSARRTGKSWLVPNSCLIKVATWLGFSGFFLKSLKPWMLHKNRLTLPKGDLLLHRVPEDPEYMCSVLEELRSKGKGSMVLGWNCQWLTIVTLKRYDFLSFGLYFEEFQWAAPLMWLESWWGVTLVPEPGQQS